MKAKNAVDNKMYYFVGKCLAFGAAISCSHFQRFSNSVAHIVKHRTGKNLVNFLDDYFFAALLKLVCNGQVHTFLSVCSEINFPVSLEKTFWATTRLVFLGFLIDTMAQVVSIPADKIMKAQMLIGEILSKESKKTTVKQLQKITGFLNFIGRCIVPGRAFTRRMYAYTKGKLQPHHHVRINTELRLDLEMWTFFLNHPSAFCRSFMDFSLEILADEVNMYSDAAGMHANRFSAEDLNAYWAAIDKTVHFCDNTLIKKLSKSMTSTSDTDQNVTTPRRPGVSIDRF